MLRDAALQVAKKPLCYRRRRWHKQGEEGGGQKIQKQNENEKNKRSRASASLKEQQHNDTVMSIKENRQRKSDGATQVKWDSGRKWKDFTK